MIDPIALAQALIRVPSVTPDAAASMDVLSEALSALDFRVKRYRFGAVDNLYAKRGESAPNFCFAGHLDVVPPGAGWAHGPWDAAIVEQALYGRGAVDMKAAIAAMVAAVSRFGAPERGSISFLITGDEEGPAIDGTVKLLAAIAAEGETLDFCLVGEPTSEARLGDVIKNGRRGSLNAQLLARGRQGHVAYPDQADNPVPKLLEALAALRARRLDEGAPGFQPSRLEVTSLDVGNDRHNVIPAEAAARLNIRFNPHHCGADLAAWVRETCQAFGVEAEIAVTGEAFYTPPGVLTEWTMAAVAEATGAAPKLSTAGGTSDARFIKDYCPVVELGLRNATAHQVDEHAPVAEVEALTQMYLGVLRRVFGGESV